MALLHSQTPRHLRNLYNSSKSIKEYLFTDFLRGYWHRYHRPNERKICSKDWKSLTRCGRCRPEARYGLPPPPRGNFVDHDFLEASCLASFLQHVSPLAMEALPSNSPLHMLPIQRHKFNIKRTEVRIHVNICRCSIKSYFI